VTPIGNPTAGYAPSDFTPIARVGVTPMTLVARPSLGLKSMDDLIAAARAKPGTLSVGVTGSVSLQAFAVVALSRAAGIELLQVPYKGGAPMMNDLLGGQLDLAVSSLPGSLPHVRRGGVQMLGVLSTARHPSAPEQPTVNESKGVKGVSIEIWAALAGPPRMPAAIVEKLNAAAGELLRDQAFTERRAKLGDMAPPPTSAAEFGRFLQAEAASYTALASGLKRQ
jgi:tripartite-type tricarboxylate transporter receptor subunit TctC